MNQERRVIWSENQTLAPEHWQFSIPWHEQFGHKDIAAIPLLVGEQVLGFLGLCFTEFQQPNQSKLEQCWTLARKSLHAALQITHVTEQAIASGDSRRAQPYCTRDS